MGCIMSSIPPQTQLLSLIPNGDIQLSKEKIIHKNGGIETIINSTPCCYLMTTPIQKKKVKKFVRVFFDEVNTQKYIRCMHNQYKDIFFFRDYIYTIEFAPLYNYVNRLLLHKICKKMNHVLIPTDIFLHKIDDKTGLIIQKMKRYNKGDLWMYVLRHHQMINVNDFVLQMACTLKTLHEKNIFLLDIKLENIFGHRVGNKTEWTFGDNEYAFVEQQFLSEEEFQNDEKRINHLCESRRKIKWIKTLEYSPDKSFPYTKRIAIRNDCFALARCIGIVICYTQEGSCNTMFWGNRDMEIFDRRRDIQKAYPNNKYLELCGNCIVEYDEYANTTFLDNLIDTATNEMI